MNPFNTLLGDSSKINYRNAEFHELGVRDWRGYSPELLCTKLHQLDWEFKSDSVQDFWNEFENQLINLVDEIVPLVSFTNNCGTINQNPTSIQNLINVRKRLLKSIKLRPCAEKLGRIRSINKEIKTFYYKSNTLVISI